jgi:hypothetical protein
VASQPQAVQAQTVQSGSIRDANSIAALSPDDVWTVGTRTLRHPHGYATVAQHWDGTTWTAVPTVEPGAAENGFYAVSGTSADDVWAVGYSWAGTGGPEKLLAEHWDGTAWAVSPVKQFHWGEHRHRFARLFAVDAIAPNDVWAVGYSVESVTFTEHWDGSVASGLHAVRARGAVGCLGDLVQ